jgi:ParB family chromosome partitioning protein
MTAREDARPTSHGKSGHGRPGGGIDKAGTLLQHFPAMSKSALGRGLGALLGGTTAPAVPNPQHATGTAPQSASDTAERVASVALHRIRPCPFQPRKEFSADTLRELADSIREQGIVQPLIVRPKDGGFELIAGERRWRAAQLAGLAEAPVIIREADDAAVLELALIENLQRENLNPVEEAQGLAQLIEQFHLRQEDAAVKVGKSRVAVANALRLLKLPPAVIDHLRNGRLSVGHAKVILALPSAAEQSRAAEETIRDALSVRQTEELIARWQSPPAVPARSTAPKAPATRDVHVAAVEARLQERLGTKVTLRYRQGRGAVEIRFFNDDDLERILQIVGVTPE